ncbi:carbohydrate ABC transporter permease [Tepidibacillus sp. HK-1]|uniref:carbohydrate ABC transporter permease n=1 Tax=Tepidibacillus sp. HK-1 TaxID=1883407 RepID=UPI0008533510|nr:sugar ABC transporter permease [Tepidibacillus sp. HK-1]GBF10450.1 sn-glycerol-3-phosphate transport system permease protein UgpA [Tepidibacillus sp. HK-1]
MNRVKSMKNFGAGMLYVGPALLLMIIFIFYPMVKTLYYSFFMTNARGTPVLFVGLENYTELLQSDSFLLSIKATLLFVLNTVPTGIILALFLAIIANEKLKGIDFFRVIFSSTIGVSVAAGSTIWLFIFHPSIGFLNNILTTIGLPAIQWLTDPKWALFSIALTTVWMSVGFNFIILLGGLQNISEELYESALIDGAGYWVRLFKITIPMLTPSLFFVTVVSVINSFQTFGQIDILTKGGPAESTNLIVYSIFQDAFIHYKFGIASAQAMILFVFVLIITIFQFKVGEKKVHYQ